MAKEVGDLVPSSSLRKASKAVSQDADWKDYWNCESLSVI